MEMGNLSIYDTTVENITQFGVCGYKNPKKEGLPEKLGWFEKRLAEGLRIKTLYSEQDGTQGMIEYIPGQYCWRPINAADYMFIHCIFVGFKNIHKNKGYATQLLNECEQDARQHNLKGIAVLTRKGSFMAGKELFIKNGFTVAASAKPDYDLLVKKFDPYAVNPSFRDTSATLKKYAQGLTIIRAFQCPYTVKNVNEICNAAEKEYGIIAQVVTLENYQQAQNSPCPFGTFCIIYNGVVVADSPVSKGRFVNIMKKLQAENKL